MRAKPMTSAALCEKTTEVTASEALTAASAILSSRTQLASQQQVAQIAAITTAKKPAARAGSGGEEPSAGDGSDGGGDDFAGLGAYDGGVAELVVEEVVDGKVVEVGDDVGVVIDDVSSDSGSGNLLAASGSGGSGGCLGGGSGGFCGGGSGDGALCGELSVERSGGVGVGGRRAARR